MVGLNGSSNVTYFDIAFAETFEFSFSWEWT